MTKRNAAISYFLAITLAIAVGTLNISPLIFAADTIACWFVKIIKWLSIPMIFLSVTSAILRLKANSSLSYLVKKLLQYTLLTTSLSAALALCLYVMLSPALTDIGGYCSSSSNKVSADINIYGAILISTLILTALVSVIVRYFNNKNKLNRTKHFLVKSYDIFFSAIQKLFLLLPIAVWAFIVQFVIDINTLSFAEFGKYLLVILLANIIQATVILPIILKFHGISSVKLFKNVLPALSAAFWAKSSSVALPVALDCSIKNEKMEPEIAKLGLPLCITLNMNACAAFILTTVLFVSQSNGLVFEPYMMILWIAIATAAALGNAGIPMGCYTMSGVIISFLGVPLTILGLILPFYSIIDMLESAINVWSDICITAILNKKNKDKK